MNYNSLLLVKNLKKEIL